MMVLIRLAPDTVRHRLEAMKVIGVTVWETGEGFSILETAPGEDIEPYVLEELYTLERFAGLPA